MNDVQLLLVSLLHPSCTGRCLTYQPSFSLEPAFVREHVRRLRYRCLSLSISPLYMLSLLHALLARRKWWFSFSIDLLCSHISSPFSSCTFALVAFHLVAWISLHYSLFLSRLLFLIFPSTVLYVYFFRVVDLFCFTSVLFYLWRFRKVLYNIAMGWQSLSVQ